MLEIQHKQQLLNNNWFAKLPQAYQQYIVQHAKYIEVAKDQAVFRSGDLFDGIYAVLNGAIRLGHVDIEGKEAVAAIAEPIMWFGEISLIDQQPRSHDAIAIQKAPCSIYLNAMLRNLSKPPQNFGFILHSLLHRNYVSPF